MCDNTICMNESLVMLYSMHSLGNFFRKMSCDEQKFM